MAFLNKEGLERLWQHIVAKIGNKVDKVEVGSLQDLTTDNKENLVAAINAVVDALEGKLDKGKKILSQATGTAAASFYVEDLNEDIYVTTTGQAYAYYDPTIYWHYGTEDQQSIYLGNGSCLWYTNESGTISFNINQLASEQGYTIPENAEPYYFTVSDDGTSYDTEVTYYYKNAGLNSLIINGIKYDGSKEVELELMPSKKEEVLTSVQSTREDDQNPYIMPSIKFRVSTPDQPFYIDIINKSSQPGGPWFNCFNFSYTESGTEYSIYGDMGTSSTLGEIFQEGRNGPYTARYLWNLVREYTGMGSIEDWWTSQFNPLTIQVMHSETYCSSETPVYLSVVTYSEVSIDDFVKTNQINGLQQVRSSMVTHNGDDYIHNSVRRDIGGYTAIEVEPSDWESNYSRYYYIDSTGDYVKRTSSQDEFVAFEYYLPVYTYSLANSISADGSGYIELLTTNTDDDTDYVKSKTKIQLTTDGHVRLPVKPLEVGSGGTGAATAAGARTNLDVYSKTETTKAITDALEDLEFYTKTETSNLISTAGNAYVKYNSSNAQAINSSLTFKGDWNPLTLIRSDKANSDTRFVLGGDNSFYIQRPVINGKNGQNAMAITATGDVEVYNKLKIGYGNTQQTFDTGIQFKITYDTGEEKIITVLGAGN